MVAQPLNVPIFPPSIAPPVEHHPLFQPTTTRNIETGNSIPHPTRRYAPIHESVSINRLTKSHTIPIETYNMTEHNFTYEESNRQPNDSFVPVGIPNMTNIADGHPVNYVPANNYDMMSNINAHEPSYQYPYMNAPVPHSYVTERVDANYCLPRVAEHCPQASQSHFPEIYSFPTNTWRWR
ncbi:hypothetical protein RF11_11259 [Thelohanellus kitauei]|uniref:Uncharacterized protein n=1 Tax=Thelohanellus kitauei TaxID=669202 RepID=A0A0C2MA26_THEKT|nr:hypothetical protein RF11_11259 [Thelohanellus kitauei]